MFYFETKKLAKFPSQKEVNFENITAFVHMLNINLCTIINPLHNNEGFGWIYFDKTCAAISLAHMFLYL